MSSIIIVFYLTFYYNTQKLIFVSQDRMNHISSSSWVELRIFLVLLISCLFFLLSCALVTFFSGPTSRKFRRTSCQLCSTTIIHLPYSCNTSHKYLCKSYFTLMLISLEHSRFFFRQRCFRSNDSRCYFRSVISIVVTYTTEIFEGIHLAESVFIKF